MEVAGGEAPQPERLEERLTAARYVPGRQPADGERLEAVALVDDRV